MSWLTRKIEALKGKQEPEEPGIRQCPYCGIEIDREPKGKFKCPSCGGEIHIQKTGEVIKFLTKEQRTKLNSERAERAAENKYYNFFCELPVSRIYLDRKRSEFFKFMSQKANYPDLTWSVANELIKLFFKSRKYQELSTLYRNMAFMLDKEGKDTYDLLYESHRYNLLYQKENMADFGLIVSIVTSGVQACPACREFKKKEFTIDEAIEKMPLPVKGCTNKGGCRCVYTYRMPRNFRPC